MHCHVSKNQGFIIDYLSFTIKPDLKSKNCKFPTLQTIFNHLNLDENEFAEIGGHLGYERTYVSNNISIYEAKEERMNDMGYHVSMTGQGLRYYEQMQKDGEIVPQFWREFLTRTRKLTSEGYGLNITRIDVALDDYEEKLNLKRIEKCAKRGEFVSRFRTSKKYNGLLPVNVVEGLSGKDLGMTIAFGSRKSNTYLRFYDKKAEQLGKCTDEKKIAEIEQLKCWNRMEFEFKKENAIKVVNSICDVEDFGSYFAEVVNGYIRFINEDSSNRSMCSLQSWWADFIGTVEKSRLAVSSIVSYSLDKTLTYFNKCVAPMVYTLLNCIDMTEFLGILDSAANRLKHKHVDIINGNSKQGCNGYEELWDALNPVPVNNRVEYVC